MYSPAKSQRPRFTSLFQSASSYSHLPFVSSTRLVSFLADWDNGLGSPEHDFLNEYFEVQEEAFHALLDMIAQVSVHLDYWLNWAMPVRRWPILLRISVRRVISLYFSALGRKKQVTCPSEAASSFSSLHGDLCRLVAFIQISTFELLASEVDTPEEREGALHQVAQNLACQAEAAKRLMKALDQQQLASTAFSSRSANAELLSPASRNEDLPRADSECRTPIVCRGRESPSVCRTAHSPREEECCTPTDTCAERTPRADEWTPRADRRDRLTRGESVDSAVSLLSQRWLFFTSHRGFASEIADPVVATGWKHLEESRSAMQVLIQRLQTHIRHNGRLRHFSKWWPLYTLAVAGGICKARSLIFDSSERNAFFNHLRAVGEQFVREWVAEPVAQLISELFRRLGTDDVLRLSIELEELRTEQKALERMLHEFVNVVEKDPSTMMAVHDQSSGKVREDLADRYFEQSMQNPIGNLLHGHLVESCMVQSQRMKVLLYASIYSIDAVLLQLKWDFLMAGIVPFMSLCGIGCWIVTRSRRNRLFCQRLSMLRALTEVDRYYNHHSRALTRKHGSGSSSCNNLSGYLHGRSEVSIEAATLRDLLLASDSSGIGHRGCHSGKSIRMSPLSPFHGQAQASDLEPAEAQVLELEKVGAALGHLDALCRLASQIRLDDVDWRSLRRDILDLASPELTVAQKLHIISTMRSTYFVILSNS